MGSEKPYFAHESSYVDDPCTIGDGTRIWHFCHIMQNSTIGRNCNFGQNVVISPGCVIGNNVKIQNNVSVYDGVTLEDDVFCGPSCVFTNIINPRAAISRNSAEHYKKTTMGEIADMVVEGECCQICLCAFQNPGLGYPFTCTGCGGDVPEDDDELDEEFFDNAVLTPPGADVIEMVTKRECPVCGKKLKGTQGVMDHLRDKHFKEYLGGGPDD